ncbi:hypothetical protein GCM10028791_37130 [Echinicola sediminis]
MVNPNKEVFKEFREISNKLISLLSPLTTTQLNQCPFHGSWSAGQVGDHLYKSYGVVYALGGTIQKTKRIPDSKVWDIKNTFLDFSIKMESPVHISPETGSIKKEVLIQGLEERISKFLTFQNKDLTEECLDFIIPEFGSFTRLEWIWFTIFHSYRHIYQLERIITKIDKKAISSL